MLALSPTSPLDPERVAQVEQPQLAAGTELLGVYAGSGCKESPYLFRSADGRVVQVSRLLHLVAAQLDGARDLDQIASNVTAELGRRVSAANVAFLIDHKLRPLGLMADGEAPPAAPRRPTRPLLALNVRAAVAPQRLVYGATTLLRHLFLAPVVLAVVAGLAAVDAWLFLAHGVSDGLRQAIFQPAQLLLVVGVVLLSAAFHELGHASACRYGGARPGAIGVGIYLVWPVFYNDVTDSYRLTKAGRLRTDLGGIYFNAVFILAVAGAYGLTGFEPLVVVILVLHLQMLQQFLPFVRLDGYYVVSDLTGVPDLFARIKPVLVSLVPGRKTPEAVAELRPWPRTVITAWVLTTVPVLTGYVVMFVVHGPQTFADARASLLVRQQNLWAALRQGNEVAAVAEVVQLLALVLPVVGMTLLVARLFTRAGLAAHRRWSQRHPPPPETPPPAPVASLAPPPVSGTDDGMGMQRPAPSHRPSPPLVVPGPGDVLRALGGGAGPTSGSSLLLLPPPQLVVAHPRSQLPPMGKPAQSSAALAAATTTLGFPLLPAGHSGEGCACRRSLFGAGLLLAGHGHQLATPTWGPSLALVPDDGWRGGCQLVIVRIELAPPPFVAGPTAHRSR